MKLGCLSIFETPCYFLVKQTTEFSHYCSIFIYWCCICIPPKPPTIQWRYYLFGPQHFKFDLFFTYLKWIQSTEHNMLPHCICNIQLNFSSANKNSSYMLLHDHLWSFIYLINFHWKFLLFMVSFSIWGIFAIIRIILSSILHIQFLP